MPPLSPAAAIALLAATACAPRDAATGPDIRTRDIEYRQGGTVLAGFVAWDAGRQGQRPGVLVVHEWWGLNDHARAQARRLAEAGYVGLALDMYGDRKVTTHPDTAQGFMMAAMSDPAAMTARFNAALEQLRKDPNVDPERIAAIGYCFGGAVVLTMARAGADLDAVVSFHGALPTAPPVDSGAVKARVLVLTGGADPMVPPEQVQAFINEMLAAGAGIEAVTYAGAKHSFTNPRADSVGMDALAYDAMADRRSWEAMLALFREVFP
jgi:dienelactone hydrolase